MAQKKLHQRSGGESLLQYPIQKQRLSAELSSPTKGAWIGGEECHQWLFSDLLRFQFISVATSSLLPPILSRQSPLLQHLSNPSFPPPPPEIITSCSPSLTQHLARRTLAPMTPAPSLPVRFTTPSSVIRFSCFTSSPTPSFLLPFALLPVHPLESLQLRSLLLSQVC